MNLQPGARLVVSSGIPSALDRVSICSGLEPITGSVVAEKAAAPKNDWRPVTEREFEILRGVNKADNIVVYLFPVPSSVRRSFEFVSQALLKSNKDHISRNICTTRQFQSTARSTAEHFSREGGFQGVVYLGHNVIGIGKATVALNHAGASLGLHLDNHNNSFSPFPNRLAINLGTEARYFVFSNHILPALSGSLKNAEVLDADQLRREYCTRLLDYPVVKIKILPGEAYVAPTQVILHDASTLDKTQIDVQLSFLGNFTASGLSVLGVL